MLISTVLIFCILPVLLNRTFDAMGKKKFIFSFCSVLAFDVTLMLTDLEHCTSFHNVKLHFIVYCTLIRHALTLPAWLEQAQKRAIAHIFFKIDFRTVRQNKTHIHRMYLAWISYFSTFACIRCHNLWSRENGEPEKQNSKNYDAFTRVIKESNQLACFSTLYTTHTNTYGARDYSNENGLQRIYEHDR